MDALTEHIEELIDALLQGTIDMCELDELRTWTFASNVRKDQVRARVGLQLWSDYLEGKHLFDTRIALQRFHRHVAKQDAAEKACRETRMRIRLYRWIGGVAAVACIVCGLWGAYWQGALSVKNRFSPIAVEAPHGSQLDITLPDGSCVRLNAGSKLVCSQGFGITNRDVVLKGEGFFDVKHNGAAPFVVTTGNLEVRDVGTAFLVSNYEEARRTQVVMSQGEVMLVDKSAPCDTLHLQKGDMAWVDKSTGSMERLHADGGEEDAREMRYINFENQCIAEIATMLSRSYNQQVEVGSGVRNLRFYGRFDRQNDTLGEVLESISKTNRIHYKRTRTGYMLY